MTAEEQTELVNRLAEKLWEELSPPEKFQPMNTGDWYEWLRAKISKTVATPNDPKLSDSGPGARMGAQRREAQARAVPGFMAGSTARD